jgi:hypothetical protein
MARVIVQWQPFGSPKLAFEQSMRRFSTSLAVSVFKRGEAMLWTIALILLVLWVLGYVSSYTLGGFIHLLLVAAIIVVLIRIIQGRRPI